MQQEIIKNNFILLPVLMIYAYAIILLIFCASRSSFAAAGKCFINALELCDSCNQYGDK